VAQLSHSPSATSLPPAAAAAVLNLCQLVREFGTRYSAGGFSQLLPWLLTKSADFLDVAHV